MRGRAPAGGGGGRARGRRGGGGGHPRAAGGAGPPPRRGRGPRAPPPPPAPSNGLSLPLLLSSRLSPSGAAPLGYERSAFQAEVKRRWRMYPGFRREARLTPGYERTAFQAEENR